MLTVRDAELKTTTNVYNDLGQVVDVDDAVTETPTDKVTRFEYDEAGNRIRRIDRKGQETKFEYDLLNRLVTVRYPADGTTETFGYDFKGDLTSLANAAAMYTLGYDNGHRLTSKTDSRRSTPEIWTYNAAGNIATKRNFENETTFYGLVQFGPFAGSFCGRIGSRIVGFVPLFGA